MFRLIAAAAALALVVPATAEAKTLRGKTSQGRSVTLVLDSKGVPKRLKIAWSVACQKNKSTGPTSTSFLRPFDQATADVVNDADSATRTFAKGMRVRNSAKLAGQRADATWSGTFSVKRSFYRKGKRFDVCRADNVTWSVS